jgi:heme/copper-type cytochrome/quinol oxidase subunit 3
MSYWERRAEASTRGQAEEERLKEKMDNVIWKMNLFIVAIVCVVFRCLLGMYAAKKSF